MTQEAIKALTDSEISQVMDWGQAELAARKEQRKQDAIAKIRELAATVGVTVSIGQKAALRRGRPPGPSVTAKPAAAPQARRVAAAK